MIVSYGDSFEGSSHAKNQKGCQDVCASQRLDNGWVIAATADGVGSCKYSDIAAKLAVETSIKTCIEMINKNGYDCDLVQVIGVAFAKAETEIDLYSLSNEHPLSEYHTTLSLVIYDGKRVTYGHCGDGGIIGLTYDGDYVKITTPQKSEGIYVVPLAAGKDTWIIRQSDNDFSSVLLATDGVYDTFFPPLLRHQPVEIYVPLARYFMDNNGLNITEKNITEIGQKRLDFLCSEACEAITDDKTIVVLVNSDVKPKEKPPEFHKEPDWNALEEEYNRRAYPHLYDETT